MKIMKNLVLSFIMAVLMVPFFAATASAETTLIREVHVENVRTPYIGESSNPSNWGAWISADKPYRAKEVRWYYSDGSLFEGEFKSGVKYKARIILETKGNYEFIPVAEMDRITVNGMPAIPGKNWSDGTMSILYEFVPVIPIREVHVTDLKNPVEGESAEVAKWTASTIPNAPYTVDEVAWFTADENQIWFEGKFEYGKEYQVRVALLPKEGYGFIHVLKMDRWTINGRPAEPGVVWQDGRVTILMNVKVECAHSYSSEWKKDNIDHWNECTKCGNKAFIASHSYAHWTQTKAPTPTKKGEKERYCVVCLHRDTASVPVVKLPATVKVSGATYVINRNSAGTLYASYKAPSQKSVKSAVVPDYIKVFGTTVKVTSISTKAFYECGLLQTVKLGQNITAIGNMAFAKCRSLTKIVLPAKVTKIGAGAFGSCPKLTSVTLGKNLKSIGAKAFFKCTMLNKVTIPTKVTVVGKQAFYGCKNLKYLTIQTKSLTSKYVGSAAFYGTYRRVVIKVPKAKGSYYKKLLRARGIGSAAVFKAF